MTSVTIAQIAIGFFGAYVGLWVVEKKFYTYLSGALTTAAMVLVEYPYILF